MVQIGGGVKLMTYAPIFLATGATDKHWLLIIWAKKCFMNLPSLQRRYATHRTVLTARVLIRYRKWPLTPGTSNPASTPRSSHHQPAAPTPGGAVVDPATQDLLAYLSTKYEVPKNTISSDYTSGSSETRAGSKVTRGLECSLAQYLGRGGGYESLTPLRKYRK